MAHRVSRFGSNGFTAFLILVGLFAVWLWAAVGVSAAVRSLFEPARTEGHCRALEPLGQTVADDLQTYFDPDRRAIALWAVRHWRRCWGAVAPAGFCAH